MMPRVLKITDLVDCIAPLQVAGPRDGEVSALAYDSRLVGPGCAFFALRGQKADGHRFIEDAVTRGATVIVKEDETPIDGVTVLTVENSRRALADASALYFEYPSERMRVVGVTGTNGKTTITYLLEAMMSAAGHRPAVIGTVNYRFADIEREAPHTTPESFELQQLIADFGERGADSLVMEVSSHALQQYRTKGIGFEVGVFSNLTPEHLDYHQTMDAYFASKQKLFDDYIVPGGGRAVVNLDDPYGRTLASGLPEVLTCGTTPEADVRAENIELSRNGIRARVILPEGEFELKSELLGGFNVSNLICAIAAAVALGLPREAIIDGIARVPVVPGRIEKIENDRDALVLVDYAHTGDALENVLKAVSELEARRIINVFGCGGDRDRSKRPVMGEVAARYGDLVIVTSDNPRSEAPDRIIEEILPGVARHRKRELSRDEFREPEARGYFVTLDRREAIRMAVDILQPGDLLVITGKGHEDYQIVGSETLHFDDREEIRQALQTPGRH